MKHLHHIIPRHMGGTDDPSNLVYLSVEEHAEAHRVLFETYGRWEDKIAWLGLSGQATKQEVIKMVLSEAGRRGGSKHDGSARHTTPHSTETKRKVSLNNPNRKPIATPFGAYESVEVFQKIHGIVVRHIFKHGLDKPISEHQISRSKLFTTEHLGKTPRELGYYYA